MLSDKAPMEFRMVDLQHYVWKGIQSFCVRQETASIIYGASKYYCVEKSCAFKNVRISAGTSTISVYIVGLTKLGNGTDRVLGKYQGKIHSSLLYDKNICWYTRWILLIYHNKLHSIP